MSFKCAASDACGVASSRTQCAFNELYRDQSGGNGTLFNDVLSIGRASAYVTVGVTHEESQNFELPYADGVFGLAFGRASCRPGCYQPVMDDFLNGSGVLVMVTVCLAPTGGTLTLGAADLSLTVDPSFSFFEVAESARDRHLFTGVRLGVTSASV